MNHGKWIDASNEDLIDEKSKVKRVKEIPST